MDENIYQIAEQIVQLHQKAYEVYLPLVEDVCSRIVSEDELSHLLDYLLDFACDEKMLRLYKRVCRKYLDVYPGCIKDYIEAYREMWEEKEMCIRDRFNDEKGKDLFHLCPRLHEDAGGERRVNRGATLRPAPICEA